MCIRDRYRCIKFPNKWTYHTTIIDRISASDSIIFSKNNLWWLLTNVDSSNIEDRSSELNIYFNTNPLSKNWISHPMNPIIFDPKRARNGGLIIQGNKFYRVYQKYGFDLYGKAMGISEIQIIDKKHHFVKLRLRLINSIEPREIGYLLVLINGNIDYYTGRLRLGGVGKKPIAIKSIKQI